MDTEGFITMYFIVESTCIYTIKTTHKTDNLRNQLKLFRIENGLKGGPLMFQYKTCIHIVSFERTLKHKTNEIHIHSFQSYTLQLVGK